MRRPSVYLAAPFLSRGKMLTLRRRLRERGIPCTSRWLDSHKVEGPDLSDDDLIAEAYADIFDIKTAAMLVVDLTSGLSTTGGLHFETGLAYAYEMPMVLMGPPTNLFHYLPSLMRCETLDEAEALVVQTVGL